MWFLHLFYNTEFCKKIYTSQKKFIKMQSTAEDYILVGMVNSVLVSLQINWWEE